MRALSPQLRGHGDSGHVALTFDDGPDPASTPLLLEVLAEQRVRATFFVLGERLLRAESLAPDLVRAGHELAVHGWDHDLLLTRPPWSVLSDLQRTISLVRSLTGRDPSWFRPAYGVLTGSALWAAHRARLRPVLWSTWGRDWQSGNDGRRIAARVLSGLAPGGTVLLHESPVGGAPDANEHIRAAVPLIMAAAQERGLAVGPLAEHGWS